MTGKTSICYILLSPTFGMHQYTADLANRAAAGAFSDGQPMEVHLVTTTTCVRDRYSPNVHLHTPITMHGTGFAREGLRASGLRRVLEAVAESRCPLVHFTGVHAWNVLLVKALRRRGMRVIHTLHDLHPHHGVRFRSLIRFWNRLIVGSVDHLLVHGRRYRQQLLDSGVSADKVTCVPLLHLFLSYEAERRLLDNSPVSEKPEGPATVLFFGRIEAYKGVDVLISAWEKASCDHPTSRLVIAGPLAPGLKLPPLPSGIELRNRPIGDAEALELFASSSLLVLPYHDATQSALVAAAYFFGLPVIVTDAGALPEYVLPGETGWIVPPGDPVALADELSLALADPVRLRRMGRMGRKWYCDNRRSETEALSVMYKLQSALA